MTAARASARLVMKGWFIPAPAPWPRTRRYLGFGGVSRRAETSLPGAASNRRCFGLGIAQDFNRSGGKGPTLPKAGRMGDRKVKGGRLRINGLAAREFDTVLCGAGG